MSKIRIYELARELGVDNRVVIAKAIEFGAPPRTSHSNSLEADEADAIRRALIREAMGGSAGTAVDASPVLKETIMVRTDRTTGTQEKVFERRQGNVIMRRKQGPGREDEGASTSRGERGVHSEGTAFAASERAVPESVKPTGMSQSGLAQPGLAQPVLAQPGSAITAPHLIIDEEETVERDDSHGDGFGDRSPLDEQLPYQGGIVSATLAEEVEELEGPEQEEEVPSPDEVPEPEEKASEERSEGAVEEVHAIKAQAEVPSAPPEKQTVETTPSAAPAPEERRIGPRILGRIELPQKRGVRVVERDGKELVEQPRRLGIVAGVSFVEEEEDSDAKKGAKKKGPTRKREFSRGDLVDYEGREGRRSTGKGGSKDRKDAHKLQAQDDQRTQKVGRRAVKLGDTISVGDLARQMSLKAGEVISKLMQLGIIATINQVIDKDTAMILIDDFGYEVESTSFDEDQFLVVEGADDEGNLVARPPIVTVMGHVDHGKTSLLDAIRKTSVAAREAGGITQHIGAYRVAVDEERTITFIDTPGHAAFTAMRARGADCTDIVILVVAADDGVMPQTIEAINHAKAAQVPIVVAVNKMDKHGANPDRVKQQLVEQGLQPEDWGGDTMFFPVSALSRQGIPELLEGILLLAEIKELKANPDRRAKGTVIEARQDRGRGIVATVLVQTGTLRVGDIYVVGQCSGRVRTMLDHRGERIEEAAPSTPVEITGLDGMPIAGDDFVVVESEAIAREVASNRAEKIASAERALASGPISLEEFSRRANNLAPAELNLVIKADVIGSLEAVRAAVEQLSTAKVKVRVLHSGVGGVTENDVQLAIASKAVIVGFGVRGEPRALADAESHRIEVRFYRVIYELLDDVKKAMVGLLAPIKKERHLGRLEVRDTFTVPKIGTVAGCFVSDGIVKRGAFVRVLRDSSVMYEGKVGSLRRFKEDVRQVQSGYECGMSVDSFNDVKVGDSIDIYEIEEVAASLD
jgi:translation initiation factor IF-2